MDLLPYILAGFFAGLVDGTIGMCYGITCTTLLTTTGVSPQVASASVHTSEIFSSFFSGLAHWKEKNIDWTIFKKLIIPGVLGAIIGALTLIYVPVEILNPLVSFYLVGMGIIVIVKALRHKKEKVLDEKKLIPVGFAGGFFDAVGGGGWGPIVTSTMMASGYQPRYAIGTANTVEFFVTVVQVALFATFIGVTEFWQVIVGLAIGAAIAAPIGAKLCKRIPAKGAMISVGILVILMNLPKVLAK